MTDDRMTRTALLDMLGVLPATLPVYFGLHNVRIDPNAGGETSHVLVQELIAHLQEHTCNHDVCVPLFDVIGGLTLAPIALGIEEVHDKIAVVLFCAPEVSARRELLTLLSDLFGVPSPNWN